MKTLQIILLFIFIHNAQAAVFCVDSSAELQSAFTTAASNGQNDEIRIKQGDYLTPGVSPFIYSPAENETVEISGGWSDFNQLQCFSQLGDPMDTTLDAEGISTVLFVGYDENIDFNLSIENVSLVDGFSGTSNAAGLQIANPHMLSVNRVYFVSNEGAQVSALRVNGGDLVNISNSVFMFNESIAGEGTVNVRSDADGIGHYFVNNTLINNSHDVQSPTSEATSGLYSRLNEDANGESQAMIINNLFWDNEDLDLRLTAAGSHYVYNNNYQQRLGTGDFNSGNISLAPQLSPLLLDFTPQPGSPLINQGRSMPSLIPIPTPFELGWSYGEEDFDGGIFGRVVDGRVDIGAVEAPPEVPIFKDGFEG